MGDNISRTKSAILALNSPSKPTARPMQRFASGGAVKHPDAKQDKAMISRHNRLMHPGQKSKLAKGGMVKKYAEGGKAILGKGTRAEEETKRVNAEYKKLLSDSNRPSVPDEISVSGRKMDQSEYDPEFQKAEQKQQDDYVMRKAVEAGRKKKKAVKKDAPLSDDYFVKRAQRMNKESAPSDGYKYSGFAKGGKVKSDKKKVMGTVGDAKKLMGALMAAKTAATTGAPPRPRVGAAPLATAPMSAPMKRGGKVKKKKC